MSKKDTKKESFSESISSQRLVKTFSKTPDLLLNSKNNQRSQNSRKNNYAPNLNVVRNKNLDVGSNEKETKKDTNNRGRNQRGKDARPNSKRINNNLVQTMGFLSEGIGDAVVQRRSENSGGYSKESSSTEPISKPRLTRSEFKHNKEELEKEQKTLSDLLDEDDSDSDDFKTLTDDIVPIKINHVTSSNTVKKKEKLEVKVKLEPVDCDEIKAEPSDSQEHLGNGTIKIEPGTEIKSEFYHTMDKLFRPNADEVILFQLPDALPQKLPDMEDIKGQEPQENELEKSNEPRLSSLDDFSEGMIGKLIRHRSGKTKLMIGNYLYDVESAIAADFQQNAVAINSNAHERSANMYSLGEINAKYNIIPDWNWLFDKISTT